MRGQLSFAQFRCGTLSIRIGTGRFHNERIVVYSVQSSVLKPDENHCLLYWTLYKNVRQKYFHVLFQTI